jgi:outer membrane biosynthesis protein TonB
MASYHSTARSRRLRNTHTHDDKHQQPFFSKANDTPVQQKEQPFFSGCNPAVVQAKLTIGHPGDPYEREADAVANRVVNHTAAAATTVQQKPAISSIQCLATPDEEKMPATNDARMREDRMIQEKTEPKEEEEDKLMQRMAAPEEEETVQTMAAPEEEKPVQAKSAPEEEVPVQAKAAAEEEEKTLQPKAQGAATAPPNLSARIDSTKGKGQALPKKTRAEMEAGIGADFSGVRLHTDRASADLNRELGAQAFTTGRDIYFNQGKYNPETTEGKRLLAHELTHVVQQNSQTRVQLLPGTPIVDKNQIAAALRWYNKNKKRYTKEIIEKIQQAAGASQTGTMNDSSVNAIALWQTKHQFAADGIAGPSVLPAMFPSGLADATRQSTFAVESMLIDWANLATPVERAVAIMEIINDHLTAVGVPTCAHEIAELGDSTAGKFHARLWTIRLNKNLLNQPSLTDRNVEDISVTAYHEARHAEQTFRTLRMKAGEKFSVFELITMIPVPPKIAQAA